MNTNFKIKNFRVFDAEGAEFELSPITILTGCNSSGKSSLVKALVLLSDCLNKLGEEYVNRGDFRLENCCIDFSSLKNLTMGRFDKVLNRNAEKGSAITFAYTVISRYLAEEICVELSFAAQESDELNRGWLSDISFKKSSGEVILSGYVDDSKNFKINRVNLACIKSNFFDWAVYTTGVDSLRKLYMIDLIGEEVGNKENATMVFEQVKKHIADKGISDSAKNGYVDLLDGNNCFSYNPTPSWETLNDSASTGTIFYLPLISKLGKLSKDEAISYILDLDKKFIDGADIKDYISKLIEEFKESKYNSFEDYYISKEDNEGLIIDNDYYTLLNYLLDKKTSVFKSLKAYATIKSVPRISWSMIDSSSESIVISRDGNFEIKSSEKEIDHSKKSNKFSFRDFYGAMVELSLLDDSDSTREFINIHSNPFFDDSESSKSHKLLEVYIAYLKSLIIDTIFVDTLFDIKYVGSNRINVQRLYTFDDRNSDFSKLLMRYFNVKRTQSGNYIPNSFTNKWLQKFDICDSIDIKAAEEGLGATIYLNKKNGERILLADEGYGISQLISVILEIEVAIIESEPYIKRNGKNIACSFSMLKDHEKELVRRIKTIAIEEPEVHLHPRYQSMLTDMFMEAYKEYNIHFIIETHSEYLIRKTQVFVAKQGYTEETLKDNPISVFYIGEDHQSQKMIYRTDGKFSNEFGAGFYDEASNLAFEIF